MCFGSMWYGGSSNIQIVNFINILVSISLSISPFLWELSYSDCMIHVAADDRINDKALNPEILINYRAKKENKS